MDHGGDAAIGAAMWLAAARAETQACGRPDRRDRGGRARDLVVLDGDDPALAGLTALDARDLRSHRRPVRHAMLAGRWVVRRSPPRRTPCSTATGGRSPASRRRE